MEVVVADFFNGLLNDARRLVVLVLLETISMSGSFADPPPFNSDAEAIAYFEGHDIGHLLDESGKHVEQVTFDDNHDVDSLLDRLQGLKHIRKLAFDANAVNLKRLRMVARVYPQIDHLCIQDTGRVPVTVYDELQSLKSLRSFARSSPLMIDPEDVPQIVSRHGPDPNSGPKMRAILSLEKLTWLSLDQLQMDGIDFQPIVRLADLETLDLSETGLTDDQLVWVGQLTKLKWLNLARTKVTDAGIKHLETLQQLGYLCLWDNPGITDKSAPSLLKLRRLEDLEIMETEISDEAMRVLAMHPWLKKLSLSGTWITDEGFMALAELKTLKSLSVEATRVTQEGVDRFRKARPDCRIETNPPEYMGWDRTKL